LSLDEHGFDAVKRRQALRYFTWQWGWRRLRTSEQIRFLMRETTTRDMVRAVVEPNTLSRRAWAGVDWSLIDRYLYVFATRLLWYYAERHGDRMALAVGEAPLGSPFPVRLRRHLVSQDLANGSLEIGTIRAGLGSVQPRQIVEIGGGYGRTAFLLLSLYPEAEYTIVDIEPARTISNWYLSTLFPTRKLLFVSPDDIEHIPMRADLVLSISSLQEMLPDQVERYLQWMAVIATNGFVYLKQWNEWNNPVDDVVLRFDDYPIPQAWERVYDAPAPVQTSFRERMWRLPPADSRS